MLTRVAQDLFVPVNKDTPTIPVPMGSNNSAMFEVWLTGGTLLSGGGATPVLEGSKDGGRTWWQITATTTATSAPAYKAVIYEDRVVYDQVRLKFHNASTAFMVSANIQTYYRDKL